MDTRTWKEFELRIPVKADLSALYEAWATADGIERWFLRSARFMTAEGRTRKRREPIQKGDSYEWLWHGYSDDVMEANPILEANGSDTIQFEFTGKCVVTVKLEKDGDSAIVVLNQERIPEDNDPGTNLYVNCQLGWTFYLTNLKSIFEGGLDLRNRDEKIGKVVTA
jgi:uncharacterized protein YndB with AHSA1/START domain